MKIGLLTFFQGDNAGQYYQALVTFNALQAALPEDRVEFVNMRHGGRWRPWCRSIGRFVGSVFKHLKYNRARSRNFLLSSPELIPGSGAMVTRYLVSQGYDLLVVGSDVCLKLHGNAARDMPYYWLSPDIGIPHIMLSSSSEFTTCNRISETQKTVVKKSFQKFLFAGVRDTMTADFLRELSPESTDKICLMPDPTVSFPVDLTAEVAKLKKLKKKVEKKLCMVNLIDTPLCRDLVRLLSQKYFVVEVGPRILESSAYFIPGPDEWCNMFNHFDLVVTTSFHESIFALKHQTPVCAVDCHPSRYEEGSGNSKTKELMLSFDLKECHINPEIYKMNAQDIYDRILQVRGQFDWPVLGDKLRQMGTQYIDTVNTAIECAKEEIKKAAGKR